MDKKSFTDKELEKVTGGEYIPEPTEEREATRDDRRSCWYCARYSSIDANFVLNAVHCSNATEDAKEICDIVCARFVDRLNP